MKRSIFLLLLSIALRPALHAQNDNAQPPYLRNPVIPAFTLIGPDSTSFTNKDLAAHKKTMIMYFSPDCDHCKHQTELMIQNIDKFKSIQIVMTTYQPFDDMVTFYRIHKIQNYPAIRMGRDAKFFFVPFYGISDLPYMALYDAKGNLIQTFEGNTPIDKILGAFEKKSKKDN